MRNIKLKIEYDGTNHAGWQVQKNAKTLQETIEEILSKILKEKVRVISSGRTDSGVHALAQVANFKTHSRLPCIKIKGALNANLPDDVSIVEAKEVPLKFHSRFSAKSKLYRYTILNRQARSAIWRNFAYHVPYPLNAQAMKKASKYLIGTHDFKSFQAADKKDRSSQRTIKKLLVKKSGDFINIDIEADGFLYNMVRNIVGTLVEVGRGKILPQGVKKILEAKNRKLAGPTAPARGLCLISVKY